MRMWGFRKQQCLKICNIKCLIIKKLYFPLFFVAVFNRDITKILDTIAINDGEAVHDLRHRLALSTEENNLLLAQLDELKQLKDELEDVNN